MKEIKQKSQKGEIDFKEDLDLAIGTLVGFLPLISAEIIFIICCATKFYLKLNHSKLRIGLKACRNVACENASFFTNKDMIVKECLELYITQ